MGKENYLLTKWCALNLARNRTFDFFRSGGWWWKFGLSRIFVWVGGFPGQPEADYKKGLPAPKFFLSFSRTSTHVEKNLTDDKAWSIGILWWFPSSAIALTSDIYSHTQHQSHCATNLVSSTIFFAFARILPAPTRPEPSPWLKAKASYDENFSYIRSFHASRRENPFQTCSVRNTSLDVWRDWMPLPLLLQILCSWTWLTGLKL